MKRDEEIQGGEARLDRRAGGSGPDPEVAGEARRRRWGRRPETRDPAKEARGGELGAAAAG